MGYHPAVRVNPLNSIALAQGLASFSASAPSQVTVGASSISVLAANPNRLRLILQNVGTTVIYIGFGVAPSSTLFHLSLPAGGTVGDGSSFVYQDSAWSGAIYAVSSSVGGLLSVTEMS